MSTQYDRKESGVIGFWSVLGYISLAVLGILLGAAIFYGAIVYFFSPQPEISFPKNEVEEQGEEKLPATSTGYSLVEVVDQALAAVVGVNKHIFVTRFGEQSLEEVESGSGVIIDPDGYIITNQHVIEGADKITVVIPGKSSYEAELIGLDPMTDLALLKIEEIDLVALAIGDSDELRVGEQVLAIGNPFGYFQQSVTAGIISAVGRQVRMPGSEYVYTFLQTDALVNPGNSGGPLLNLKSEIIGINTAKISLVGVEGIGLAIPSNTVKRVLADLFEHGRVIRPHLGVVIDDWLRYGADEPERGVIIVDIAPDSAADNAGLQAEDIIVAIDGHDVHYLAQLFDRLFSYYPGDTVTITYFRDGESSQATVTLGERPENLPSVVEVEELEPESDDEQTDEPDDQEEDQEEEDEVTGNPVE